MSKKLDDELAQAAIGAGDAVVSSVASSDGILAPSGGAELRVQPTRKKNLGLLLTLLARVGALVALFLGLFQRAAVYATPVDKLVNEPAVFAGRKVRVEGELLPGTLVKRD